MFLSTENLHALVNLINKLLIKLLFLTLLQFNWQLGDLIVFEARRKHCYYSAVDFLMQGQGR